MANVKLGFLCLRRRNTRRTKAGAQSGEIRSARSFEWLPDRANYRTSAPKTCWEITPFYSRIIDRRRCIVRGERPRELPEGSRITARQWKMYQAHLHRQSPILTGLRYLKLFEQESVTSYAKAAAVLGVSRIRVYQLVSLVTKLPQEITTYLVQHNDDPTIRCYFTERRLRPLVKLSCKEEQMATFKEMLEHVAAQIKSSV